MDPDFLTLTMLLLAVIAALTFPGGPGTPRRFLNPARAFGHAGL